jgi:hypothetical protein
VTARPKTPIFSHIITIDKLGVILGMVGWRSWAKSREEQQVLAQQLIELRDDLREWNEALLKEESS